MNSKTKRIPVTKQKGSEDVMKRLSVLDSQQPHAVLATAADNEPYTSLIAYALTPDMKGILFVTPRRTRKYRNIVKNKRVSLLIDTRSNARRDYIKAESVTVLGSAHSPRGKKRDELAKVFLSKHPMLREFTYADSSALVYVKISRCIHVSSFQVVSEHTW